ncbi:S8/S53 family peptidase [Taibaiella sp. KBW10]|uniref:S8/S53 family peptidase n=1 Tax=Taibaiella sp. KBW10 TaxID=2153357 RepID=UPI001315AB78|nr:S8/S53 family peptidase [Taibaiella sp. KBW10]
MKKSILFIILSIALSGATALAQNDKLYVAFKPAVPLDNRLINEKEIMAQSPVYKRLKEAYGLSLANPFDFTDQKLAELSANAIKLVGNDDAVAQLKKIFLVQTASIDKTHFEALIKELQQMDIVAYVSTHPLTPIAPPADIAPVTPNFEAQQSYIGVNPGVNMRYAWDKGFFGQNVKVRDVEYGVNINHEDLEDQNITIQPGKTIEPSLTTAYTEHGTAVLGILAANKGDYGISGMVPNVTEAVLYPEYTVETGYDRALAVSSAINNTSIGDVVIYEMQTGGVSGYAPAEYDNVIWSLTKAATDAGIIIVAAAANGSQNLDAPAYATYMARGNSGAIMVGAGTNTTAHTRLNFSNYGSRVDLQAWGTDVFSTGYGDAHQIGGDFNQTYTNFSGTSSATPIVASCVVNLQAYYRHLTGGNSMTGQQIKTILRNTGIPQGSPATENIGPLPNMKAAMEYLAATLSTEDIARKNNIFIYPNPVADRLYIKDTENKEVAYRIFDIYGKVWLTSTQKGTDLDVSSLSAGIYFLQLSGDRYSYYQKFIKQ